MTARLAAALVLAASPLAGAQPLGPRPQNLHVNLSCAESPATLDHGLAVTVDGVAMAAVQDHGVSTYSDDGYLETWLPGDVGYSVPPGVHRVRFSAPGCAPLEQVLALQPVMPIFVAGRLPVTDPSLRGPTGAPDGAGVVLGAYANLRGAHDAQDPVFSTHYAYEPTSTEGLWLSIPYEHRGFVFAFDLQTGGGPVSGTATTSGSDAGRYPLDGTAFEVGSALRLGARSSLDHFAIAAGTGLGGDLWLGAGDIHGGNVLDPSFDATWYVPVWTAVDYKPSCSWGVQLLASYDVHPGDTHNDAPAFGAGLLWQPSSACAEQPGLSVH